MKGLRNIGVLISCVVLTATGLKLPTVVGSNMVLSREPLSARVWGWANATTEPEVKLSINGGAALTATTAANGTWFIDISPQPVSSSNTFVIYTALASQTLTNIAFGDLWLCSGQSNMEFSVNDAFNASEEIADSINYPDLRLFTVAKTIADVPQYDCASKSNYSWDVSGPEAFVPAGGVAFSWFSATCYFFGRDLYRSLDGKVPIGLVASDWGGQKVEAFSSPDAMADTTCGGTVEKPVLPPADNPATSQLWYAMIYPLLPLRFTGATWYQGEANAGDPDSYACRFPAMITDWRSKFNLPDLSFFFVQLAGYSADYSKIRAAQMAALKLTKVGYAIAIDIGDPTSPEGNIHPRRKQEIGRRLSLSVLAIQYNESVSYLGPTIESYYFNTTQTGVSATMTFSNADNLHSYGTAACVQCCNEAPFVLSDGVISIRPNFTISENVVTAVSSQVFQPTFIQYDWEGYPQCAIYNGEGGPDNHTGLPAPPFETSMPPPINYTLVFRQTWPFQWPVNQASMNPTDPTAAQYSILDKLEDYRVDGQFGFKIKYPNASGSQIWSQTSNPATVAGTNVTGYKPISLVTTEDSWGGLEYNTDGRSLMDGSIGSFQTWWYAVGSMQSFESGIPAYGMLAAPQVELYVLNSKSMWSIVFRQTVPFFYKAGEWSLNKDDPDADNYSILDQLESFRLNGQFTFKLMWPDQGNTWSQQTNPVTAATSGVQSYLPGRILHSDNCFGGLEHNIDGGQSLIDGSPCSTSTWFYTIGDYGNCTWGSDGIPGWNSPQTVVELWVRRP